METLTLVCRDAMARQVAKPAKNAVRYGYDAGHNPGKAGDVIHGGDWSQCGATATFEALTLSEATQQALRAGWSVDRPHVGQSSRLDRCPECGGRIGRRGRRLQLEDLGVDRLTTRQLPLAFTARG